MPPLLIEFRFLASDREADRKFKVNSVFVPFLKHLIDNKSLAFSTSVSAGTLAQLEADGFQHAIEHLHELLSRENVSLALRDRFSRRLFVSGDSIRRFYLSTNLKCLEAYSFPAPTSVISSNFFDELIEKGLCYLDVGEESERLLSSLDSCIPCEQLPSAPDTLSIGVGDDFLEDSNAWVESRLAETALRLSESAEKIDPIERDSLRVRLLRQACGFFCAASEIEVGDGSITPLIRKLLCSKLISADVILDRFECPDVDPLDGWVSFRKGSLPEQCFVETQLMKVCFVGGEISALDYKPRKHNFIVASESADGLSLSPSAAERLTSTEAEIEVTGFESEVLRETSDQLWYKTTHEAKLSSDCSFKLVRFFRFRAGVGAHLKEATTGFSVEYWMEGLTEAEDGILLQSRWSLVLPTASDEVLSLHPLLSVGGVADERLSSDDLVCVEAGDIRGGCFGVRVIDGISSNTLDFRFSRELYSMSKLTLRDVEGAYQGTQLLFELRASELTDSVTPTSLFVSIV